MKVKVKASKKIANATSKSGHSERPAVVAGASDGIRKQKHTMAKKRQHALLPQLQAQAVAEKRPGAHVRDKARKKRAGTATISSAISGIRATLDELLTANEQLHKDAAAASDPSVSKAALTSKKRQKMVVDETHHMQRVLEHPAFVADPFAALAEHLQNTVGGPTSKESKKALARGESIDRSKRPAR